MNAPLAQELGPKPNICILSRQRVVGRTNGSSAYLLSIAEYLKGKGFRLHYLSPSPATCGRWPVIWLGPETDLFDSIRIRGAARLGRAMVRLDPMVFGQAALAVADRFLARLGLASRPLGKPAPYAIAVPLTARDEAFIARHAPPLADVILLDYAFLTPAIPHVRRPDAPSIVLMHDLFSARRARFDRLGLTDSVATISEAEELRLLGAADLVVAIQDEEAACVREGIPGHAVTVAPMAAQPAPQPHVGEGDLVLFVGSKTAPNVDGLQWFIEEVWEGVRSRRPSARLLVAGSVAQAYARPAEGVTYLGIVRDLGDLYRRAGVVIAPLRAGSGLKVKLIEALSWGKAIVATSTTTQGVGDLVRHCVAVAEEPWQFADAVLRFVQDDAWRSEYAARALDVARRHFGPEACYGGVLEFITARMAATGTGERRR